MACMWAPQRTKPSSSLAARTCGCASGISTTLQIPTASTMDLTILAQSLSPTGNVFFFTVLSLLVFFLFVVKVGRKGGGGRLSFSHIYISFKTGNWQVEQVVQ